MELEAWERCHVAEFGKFKQNLNIQRKGVQGFFLKKEETYAQRPWSRWWYKELKVVLWGWRVLPEKKNCGWGKERMKRGRGRLKRALKAKLKALCFISGSVIVKGCCGPRMCPLFLVHKCLLCFGCWMSPEGPWTNSLFSRVVLWEVVETWGEWVKALLEKNWDLLENRKTVFSVYSPISWAEGQQYG